MKRIISIAMCLIMAAVATQVSAQKNERGDKKPEKNEQSRPEHKPEDMAKHRADRMKERLSLNEDQYAKVLELNQAQMKDRQGPPPSREEMNKLTDEQKTARREEMKKQRDEYDAKLKTILTDEQYAKYEEFAKESPRGPRPEGHGHGQRDGKGKN